MFISLLAWKNSINSVIEGVGMLFSPCALKSLISIEEIQLKMMCASFNSNPNTTILSSYSPTNASDETDIITFYNKLSSLVQHIPKHNTLIISGDMNAQKAKDENNKFCLHNSSNRNGEYLTDFSHKNILNSKNWGKTMNLHLSK